MHNSISYRNTILYIDFLFTVFFIITYADHAICIMKFDIRYIIQIMTDHEGNRKIYLARGIQEGLETVDPEAKPRVIVNCFQARLNPESQMDLSVG